MAQQYFVRSLLLRHCRRWKAFPSCFKETSHSRSSVSATYASLQLPSLQLPSLHLPSLSFFRHQSSVSIQLSNNDNLIEPGDKYAKEVQELSPEMARKLKMLKIEYDVWQSFGKCVPDKITDETWLDILYNYKTVSSRKRFYIYLFKIEKMEVNEMKKKKARLIVKEQKDAERDRLMKEGLYEEMNTLFMKVREGTMNQSYNNNLYYALMNGPHVVFDMSYDEYMSKREIRRMNLQMMNIHGANKVKRQPFHLHFCNVEKDGRMEEALTKKLPGFEKLPYTISEQSYLDHYPKEKLVYLSPNGRNILHKFDHNDVYIIGGLVDLGAEEPLSYTKAKKEGIRCAKLPLDVYLKWKMGSKALTLDHMTKILLTLVETENDWDKALEHVPRRKVDDLDSY